MNKSNKAFIEASTVTFKVFLPKWNPIQVHAKRAKVNAKNRKEKLNYLCEYFFASFA